MLLNTAPFVAFFALVFIVYWKIRKQYQWVLLLLASYYFFASWKPAYLGIILVTTLVNYFCALAISGTSNRKKLFLVLALLLDLGALFIFKYFNFFSYTTDQLLHSIHLGITLPQFSLLLPIGISFYTFQVIGYMLDVYRKKRKAEKHFGYFALFVCFFPQLSAGPIERADELLPQIKTPHSFDYQLTVSGLKLFTFGLFKKMVIADNLAVIVDRVFNALPSYKGLSLIIAVVLFSWQLYTDFSGYTDMSRGIAKMLGINLVENFNLPYLATSVRDFWRRWHMSLSRWARDYLYIPLGGNRLGLIRACVNTVIVFVLVGLWHGAAWTFVLWGLFHGIVMAAERIIEKLYGNRLHIPEAFKITYAYIAVCISWVFFRASTLPDAFYVIRYGLVGLKSFVLPRYWGATLSQLFITNRVEMVITLSLLALAVVIENVSKKSHITALVDKQPALVRMVVYALVVFAIVQLRNADIKAFIYTRF